MLSLHFAALCSGSVSFFSMDVFYTASWRAREDRVDFVLAANTSKQWLAIGFTDKQMMVYLLCIDIVTFFLLLCLLEI